MKQFMKSDAWAGKHLTLYVGGADRTIRDGEVLTGDQWVRFVGMGYLKEVPVGVKSNPQVPQRPLMLSEPEKPEASRVSMTKSPAAKAAKAMTTKNVSTKPEVSEPAPTPEPEPEPAPTPEPEPEPAAYDKWDYNDLMAEAAKRDLDTVDRKKETLVAALRESDEGNEG